MVKKTRIKGKDDDKLAKGGGNKPVKVVTFDTPKRGRHLESPVQPQFSTDWEIHNIADNEEAISGSPAWGETAGTGGWNNSSSGWPQSSAPAWPSSTSEPVPVPQPVSSGPRSPPPTSLPPPRPPSAAPDAETTTKDSQEPMLAETHDGYQAWEANHDDTANQGQWASPLSNATTHIAPASPTAESHSLLNTTQSFGAAATTMRNVKYTSASEMARRNARTSAASQPTPQPASQPAPIPPKPPTSIPPLPVTAQLHTPMSPQRRAAGSKSTPVSPTPIDRFNNRDDYAVVAAALNRDIKRAAAAAGHYNPKNHDTKHGGWTGPTPHTSGWDDPPRDSGWNQQGKRSSGGWPQPPGAEGWGGHKGGDAGWDTRSKRSGGGGGGGGGGWGNGSEAGWGQSGHSEYHHTQKHRSHSQPSQHHKPSKSWQAWGKQGIVETESESDDDDEEWEEDDEDWYTSKAGGGWGDKTGGGFGGKAGGGWGDKAGGGWGDKAGGGWGDKGAASSWGKENGGWNASGGDGWTMNSSGWDQPQHDQGWGVSQGTWGESKVITDPPENAGTRNVLSPQQRSQILNNLLNNPQGQMSQDNSRYPHGVALTDNPAPHRGHKPEPSWGPDSGWGPIHEEDEEQDLEFEDGHPHSQARPKEHDPWSNRLDNASYSMPSKTLAYAYKDTKTSLHQGKPRSSIHDYTTIQFAESHGAALKPVEQALFGRARWAKDRIHWMFPPDKDERVSVLLAWIESMSYHLATLGLHKFLQSRERGALITNADYRLPEFPSQPVFDWLTFDQLQGTMDKIMQESVVFYDPAVQVIVYVLLPSKSGNSVAMWRRKIKVPNNARLMYQAHINQAVAALKKEEDYVVYVDRLPLKPEDPDKPKTAEKSKAAPKVLSKSPTKKLPKDAPAPPKKKRKWWQLFK